MSRTIRMGKRICIVCEGHEEVDYLTRLIELKVFDNAYAICLKNAKSINNIAAVYQYEYNNTRNDLVLVFCDTEEYPYSDYNKVTTDLEKILGSKAVVEKVLYFANPCTMQIILSHFSNVRLDSSSKSSNSRIIKSYTGVAEYRATQDQRSRIMSQLSSDNYVTMKRNIGNIFATDPTQRPGTNFASLIKYLESPNMDWVKKINRVISK